MAEKTFINPQKTREPKAGMFGEATAAAASKLYLKPLWAKKCWMQAASSSYWTSPAGLVRRMDGLSQDMNFRIVNNAMRMIAPLNGVQWLQWITQGDDRVCPDCVAAASGGDGHGFYQVSWFMPVAPKHFGCRCEIMLLLYDPRQPAVN